MQKQKFKKDDLVRITGGKCECKLAVVEHSYAERYGGDDVKRKEKVYRALAR